MLQKYMHKIRKEMTVHHVNINVKGGGYFYSFSTQIYTITLSQLTKD